MTIFKSSEPLASNVPNEAHTREDEQSSAMFLIQSLQVMDYCAVVYYFTPVTREFKLALIMLQKSDKTEFTVGLWKLDVRFD